MNAIDTTAIVLEITNELSDELSNEPAFNPTVLQNKVRNACREVIMKRNYVATKMSEDAVLSDLYNYYSVISSLALYDYNQIGAEGQSNHSENGTNRSWVNRDDLLKGVHAFVKVL